MRTRIVRTTASLAGVVAVTLAVGGCASGASDEVTTLDFFQYKGEALQDFAEIIEDFEAENPDIRIVQNQVADSETAIRTLLVKDRAPDVITLNGNGNYGALAKAGVFADFSDDAVLDRVSPAMQDILADLGNAEGEVNGLGYVSNANGIIYNTEIFAANGLEVPETWDELIAVCEALQAAGITPFASSLSESWTVMPSFNAIGAYAAEDGFFESLRAEGDQVGPESDVSFSQDFPDVMAKEGELFRFSQEGYRGATYDDATSLFATGGAAMMMQGIWALSPVKNVNPDTPAAIFPYPVPEDPADRVLVSGVDIVVTMGENTPNRDEAIRFIEFLFERDVIEEFAASQNMFPGATDAAISSDPALQSVAPYVEEGRIAGFIDHQVPTAIPLVGIVQQAMFDEDFTGALTTLDSEWRKVAARTIPVSED